MISCHDLTFPRQELVKRHQHLQLRRRSPWDCHQVYRCLHFMVVYVQSASLLCSGTAFYLHKGGCGFLPLAPVPVSLSTPNNDHHCWFHGPASFNDLHIMVVNPGDFLEFLVYDQAGSPSATSMTRRWPGNATGWFAEVQYVGGSDPLFGQLLAQLLPPTGGVPHVCSSISLLCCTWVSWPERDVVHSDTVRRRSATFLSEAWVSPAVVPSAVRE